MTTRSSPSVWMTLGLPIDALPLFVNVAPMADSANFDVFSRLDKDHAPVAGPQPGARPPVNRLTLPAPVSAKRAILVSMSARTLGGSLRSARRASWVQAIVFTNANISNRDNFSQRISQTVMQRAAMGRAAPGLPGPNGPRMG